MIRASMSLVGLVGVVAMPMAAQSHGLEFEAGGLGIISTRNASTANAVGSASGTLGGGEAVLRWRYVGVGARYLTGSFSNDPVAGADIKNLDAWLSLGSRVISLEGGYGTRTINVTIDRTWTYLRAGGRINVPLGASRLTATLAGAFYLSPKQTVGGNSKASGKEAETAITYAFRQAPLYLRLGYRIEQFTIKGAGAVVDSPEEISGITLGGGLRIGK